MQKIPIKQKISLIIFGVFLCVFLLEIGLRLGGLIFSSLQEYRNRVSLKQKGVYRILCLGESTTAGGRESYSDQVEEILNHCDTGTKFSVINKGMVGIDTSYILEHLEENINKYKPDMIITMMGINDMCSWLPYKDENTSKVALYFRSFRIYKLTKILWLHMIAKAEEISFIKSRDKKDLNDHFEYIDYNPSEESLKKAIKINPQDEKAYINLGQMCNKVERFAEAEEMFKKAIEIDPRSSQGYVELARCYSDQGKDIQFESFIKKAIELNPRDNSIYYELGRHYMLQGRYLEAEGSFKKSIEIHPQKDSVAYVELGFCFIAQKRYSEAEELFKRAILSNGDFEGLNLAYGGLVAVYHSLADYKSMYLYTKILNNLRKKYYNPMTYQNYRNLKKIIDEKGIELICVQYPMRSIEPLKRIFEEKEEIIFVDNERVFKEAVQKEGYQEYFCDMFGGDFGHCTFKGNRLLAENIAKVILRRVFNK